MSSTLEPLHVQTDKPQVNEDELSYEKQHKPSSEFASREQYLEHELQIMAPKRWRPNLPFKDYRFEVEDTIPAMAGRLVRLLWSAPLPPPLQALWAQ
ncbi:integral membrane protein rhomboid family [Vibrio ponticus]|nr:integral membrane protein rhomboid family [Vibrio ponticus]